VASLCMWDLCEIRLSPFLAAPPRPYMGGEVSGSGPSRLQVYANPNYFGLLELRVSILFLGCSR
jgi:hypothetical protein